MPAGFEVERVNPGNLIERAVKRGAAEKDSLFVYLQRQFSVDRVLVGQVYVS